MAHFKRHRPKNRRAGCLMCKRWKVNGTGRLSRESEAFSSHKRRIFTMRQIAGYRGLVAGEDDATI